MKTEKREASGSRRGEGEAAARPQRILHRYLSSTWSYCHHHKQRSMGSRPIIPCGKALASHTIFVLSICFQRMPTSITIWDMPYNSQTYIFIYIFIPLSLLGFLYSLLVGAPLDRNRQPNTNASGALYRCPISTDPNDCEQVITDGRRCKYISISIASITRLGTKYKRKLSVIICEFYVIELKFRVERSMKKTRKLNNAYRVYYDM